MIDSSWRYDLLSRYPGLFEVNVDGMRYQLGYPAVGDGWQKLLERAVGRIAAAAPDGGAQIEEIKSKYGTLRLYVRTLGTNAAIEEAVALAEARSACTCETCGCEGALYSVGSWLITACTEHARGVLVPIAPGYRNLHVTRGYVGGVARIVACLRYDREADRFVAVDPATLQIEGN